MVIKIKFSKSTQTFRLMPHNYWAASIRNNELIFDSWDGMTRKLFKKNPFLKTKIKLMFLKLKNTKNNETILCNSK